MISDLKTAARSISQIAVLQRDLYVVNAKLHALRQVRQVFWIVGGLIVLHFALMLTLLWIAFSLYRAGGKT